MAALPTTAPLQLQDLAATAALSSAAQILTPSSHAAATVQPASALAGHNDNGQDDDDEADEADDLVSDARRNWSNDVTLTLVKTWKRVCELHPTAGRVVRMQIVYDQFQEAVDCSNRSRKAVEDKLYSVKQMYQFIVKTSSSFHRPHTTGGNVNSTPNRPTPAWFELTKDERRVVRSLHRVRIPNISLDVFHVLDSVLNPSPPTMPSDVVDVVAPVPSSKTTMQGDRRGSTVTHHQSQAETSEEVATQAAPASASDSVEIVDNKRNWSHEVTLQLARAWHDAVQCDKDLRGAMLSQRVFSEFLKVVGSSSRSRKAIEDKMHSMKEMYRFIRLYNAGCGNGSTRTWWFDLSKPERRQIRNAHKIRVPNLSPEVYAELETFMSQTVDVSDSIPNGFSQLLAAQQNLSMSASPAASASASASALAPVPVTSASAVSYGAGQADAMSQLNAAVLNSTYEAMRRLAEEENQLVPPSLPISGQSAQASHLSASSQATGLVAALLAPTPTPTPATAGESIGTRGGEGPPTKRQRTAAEPASEQHLAEVLTLQRQAITERRQQHAEQMALLHQIVALLRQQSGAPR